MKNIFIVLLLAILPLLANAKADLRPKAFLGDFGIKRHATIEEYQKYVGCTVKYLGGKTMIGQHIDKEGFIEIGGDTNKEYVISKISGNNEQMQFILKEKDGKKKIKLIINNKDQGSLTFREYRYCITHSYTVPLLLVDKLNEAKTHYIGKTFSSYEIIDVLPIREGDEYDLEDHYPRIKFQLKNSINGSKQYCDIQDIKLIENAAKYIGKKYSNLHNNPSLEINNNHSSSLEESMYYIIVDFQIEKKKDYIENKTNKFIVFTLQHSLYNSTEKAKIEELSLFNALGARLYNSIFNHTYQVVKVINNQKREYVVINSLTGQEKTIPIANAKVEAFKGDASGKYHAILSKVDKPQNAANRYGKTITISEDGISKYRYTDNIIDILIFANAKQFLFSLKNLSTNTIKVIWDEAMFVDVDGTTSKIMHNGIKYIQREENQPSTPIIKDAKLEDVAIPTSKIYYSDDWNNRGLYSKASINDNDQTIKLMLPIEIKGVINEYIFEFKVKYIYDNPDLIRM